ncbi:hypothetical protein [Burkholderia sp. MSMB1078WGS]|nr:hypothetical protein [Burkholderia sp. MSMB1078WGS]
MLYLAAGLGVTLLMSMTATAINLGAASVRAWSGVAPSSLELA